MKSSNKKILLALLGLSCLTACANPQEEAKKQRLNKIETAVGAYEYPASIKKDLSERSLSGHTEWRNQFKLNPTNEKQSTSKGAWFVTCFSDEATFHIFPNLYQLKQSEPGKPWMLAESVKKEYSKKDYLLDWKILNLNEAKSKQFNPKLSDWKVFDKTNSEPNLLKAKLLTNVEGQDLVEMQRINYLPESDKLEIQVLRSILYKVNPKEDKPYFLPQISLYCQGTRITEQESSQAVIAANQGKLFPGYGYEFPASHYPQRIATNYVDKDGKTKQHVIYREDTPDYAKEIWDGKKAIASPSSSPK